MEVLGDAENSMTHDGVPAHVFHFWKVLPEDWDKLRLLGIEYVFGTPSPDDLLGQMEQARDSQQTDPVNLSVDGSPMGYKFSRRGRQVWEIITRETDNLRNSAEIYGINKGFSDIVCLTLIGTAPPPKL